MRLEKGDNSSKRSGLRKAPLRWPTEDKGEKRERDKITDTETREKCRGNRAKRPHG